VEELAAIAQIVRNSRLPDVAVQAAELADQRAGRSAAGLKALTV
jgi:hypothetical protein